MENVTCIKSWMWLWQSGLLVGNLARSRGLEVDDHCDSFQLRAFCASVIMGDGGLCHISLKRMVLKSRR